MLRSHPESNVVAKLRVANGLRALDASDLRSGRSSGSCPILLSWGGCGGDPGCITMSRVERRLSARLWLASLVIRGARALLPVQPRLANALRQMARDLSK